MIDESKKEIDAVRNLRHILHKNKKPYAQTQF